MIFSSEMNPFSNGEIKLSTVGTSETAGNVIPTLSSFKSDGNVILDSVHPMKMVPLELNLIGTEDVEGTGNVTINLYTGGTDQEADELIHSFGPYDKDDLAGKVIREMVPTDRIQGCYKFAIKASAEAGTAFSAGTLKTVLIPIIGG